MAIQQYTPSQHNSGVHHPRGWTSISYIQNNVHRNPPLLPDPNLSPNPLASRMNLSLCLSSMSRPDRAMSRLWSHIAGGSSLSSLRLLDFVSCCSSNAAPRTFLCRQILSAEKQTEGNCVANRMFRNSVSYLFVLSSPLPCIYLGAFIHWVSIYRAASFTCYFICKTLLSFCWCLCP